jgi:hypothetical protein
MKTPIITKAQLLHERNCLNSMMQDFFALYKVSDKTNPAACRKLNVLWNDIVVDYYQFKDNERVFNESKKQPC